jgi:hypothetical protein
MTRPRARAGKPDLSVVVPVNAQGDLGNVRALLGDLARYDGPLTVETVLVVNNFAPGAVPREVSGLRDAGAIVLAIPSVRKPGEAVGFSARIPGLRSARAEHVVLFDADCRVPNPTVLLDWYWAQLREGAGAAYTKVGFHDLPEGFLARVFVAIHHAARWIKRALMRVPTTRGSNYAVDRDHVVFLYDQGWLADEMNVGPTLKRFGRRVVYSARPDLRVLTSGRMLHLRWRRLLPYFIYRLRYNLRVLPVRRGVALVTGRERDPVRRYRNNRPIRTEGA